MGKIDLDLEALSKLEAEATPGPWCHVPGHGVGATGCAVHCLGDDGPPDANTRFLIALRNAAPALLEKAKRLDELEDALEFLDEEWGATMLTRSKGMRTSAERDLNAENVLAVASKLGWSPKGGQGE
jgi:hypothetical protein